MAIRRTSYCVYDTRYHLVGLPYRKWVLQGAVRERVRELFLEVAEPHGFEIEELAVDNDHVRVVLNCPPRYSIGQVVGLLKAVNAREIRVGFPEVRQQLWRGRVLGRWVFCSDGGRHSESRCDQDVHSISCGEEARG